MSLWRASRTNRAAPAGAGLPLLARSVFNFVQPGNVLNLSYSLRDREVTAFLCSSLAAKVSSIFVSWVSWPSECNLCRPNIKNSIRARCIAIGIVQYVALYQLRSLFCVFTVDPFGSCQPHPRNNEVQGRWRLFDDSAATIFSASPPSISTTSPKL
jgi:hypothetical protein